MDKLIEYIWENWKIETKYFQQVVNKSNNNTYYVIQVILNLKSGCIYYLLIIKPLFQALFSFLIFLVLYTYEIKLFSKNLIDLIILYLNIFFLLFILYIIYSLVYGFYLYKIKEYGNLLFDGILNFFKLLNFLININIVFYFLNFQIEVFLQYNALFVIDISMIVVFWVYRYLFDFEIKGHVSTFLSYPWIPLCIFFILGKIFKVNIAKFHVFVKNFAFFFLGNSKKKGEE